MEKTPLGTPVGVDDPYDYVERCDHVTDDGRCRYAFEHAAPDSTFFEAMRARDYACPVVSEAHETHSASNDARGNSANRRVARDSPRPTNRASGPETREQTATPRNDGAQCDPRALDWEWADCPQFRCTNRSRECIRCGLDEVRMAHDDARPLLEEHHLSYRASSDGEKLTHEITVSLCRWCHAKVHDSFARIDDDANPTPEALAEREERRSRELGELGFDSAADRYRD